MRRQASQDMGPVAARVWAIVKETPGIHFRGLARAAEVSSTGQLRHHVDRLRRRGALMEVEDGPFRRFFVPGDHDPRMRVGMTRFARRLARLIGRLLLERAMNRTELRRSLRCADSTLGYHLTRLVASGDVTRIRGPSQCLYSLADPAFVRLVLLRWAAPTQAAGTRPAAVVGYTGEGPPGRHVPGDPGGRPPDAPEPPGPATPFPPVGNDPLEAADAAEPA